MKLELRTPRLSEMAVRQSWLSDPSTMAYNRGRGSEDVEGFHADTGCIDFPIQNWRYWRDVWLWHEPNRYSAYVKNEETGEITPAVYELSFKVNTVYAVDGTIIYNKATVESDDPFGEEESNEVETVIKNPPAFILKSADKEEVNPGEQLEFGNRYIIPKPFDRRLYVEISYAVAKAAVESGAAAPDTDLAALRAALEARQD